MFNSKKYWNDRYLRGGNSGQGSYNHLAQIKGDVINDFIKKNQIKTLIDYGVGDGNQLKLINTENLTYTGIDVSEFIISKCKEDFKDDKTKLFIHVDDIDNDLKADLVLSCDVIYHLIEDHVYKEYMNNLFSMSKKYVIIYAPNINYNEAVHVKKCEFIDYIFDNFPNFNLIKRIKKNIGCPFYIFQKNDTYTPMIPKNILQVTKTHPVGSHIVNRIKTFLNDYNYFWFNDENMYKYIVNNQLEEFHNIINHIKSLTKGQHKADIFRYYWLYLNGGIFIDDDLMIEKKINFKYNTFVSVKSYHTNENILFNGFIACSKFNPIIYKALKQTYFTSNTNLLQHYHLFCRQLYTIYQNLNKNQNTFLLQEKKSSEFIEGVKSYYNNEHLLTHWCYSKKIKISNNNQNTYIEETTCKNEYIKDIFDPKVPVYISLTSIFKNQDILLQTLESIMDQTRLPDKIVLYLSEESFILDTGFKDKKITDTNLLTFINNNSIIDIKWVKNTGSYRKLLPLLKEKWEEDCIIITIDDDVIYSRDLIKNLVNDYNKYKCVISYRGFTPDLDDNVENFDYFKGKELVSKYIYNFSTGVGGILYKPEFFHKTKDLIFDETIFLNTCDKQDDIWFYIIRILNDIDCYIDKDRNKWIIKDITKRDGLYQNYNSKNNQNTIAFKDTINLLKKTNNFI